MASSAGSRESLESLLNLFVGMVGNNEDNKDHSSPYGVDAKSIMNMSDEQRMDLYNKILKEVTIKGTYESA